MIKLKHIASNAVRTLALPVGMFVVLFALTRLFGSGGFGSFESLRIVAQQTMMGAAIALAMACNMRSDRWDFSIGMMMITTSIIGSSIAGTIGLGAIGLLLSCILVGVVASALGGALYILMKVSTLVVSIGMMLVYESVNLVYNKGGGARITDFSMLSFGKSPYVFILGLAAGLLFYTLYTHSRFGYELRALSGNQALANSAGINERKNIMYCYMLCGVMVGVAGTINLSLTGSVMADVKFNAAMSHMFEAFPPVFIGFYLSRYTNLTVGVFIGAFTMKLLTAGMLALGIPAALQNVGVGLFLLAFIAFTTNQARLQEAGGIRRRIALVASYISDNAD
jgi:ribose transport system permease protein